MQNQGNFFVYSAPSSQYGTPQRSSISTKLSLNQNQNNPEHQDNSNNTFFQFQTNTNSLVTNQPNVQSLNYNFTNIQYYPNFNSYLTDMNFPISNSLTANNAFYPYSNSIIGQPQISSNSNSFIGYPQYCPNTNLSTLGPLFTNHQQLMNCNIEQPTHVQSKNINKALQFKKPVDVDDKTIFNYLQNHSKTQTYQKFGVGFSRMERIQRQMGENIMRRRKTSSFL